MRWSRAAWGSVTAAALLHLGVTTWLSEELNRLDPRATGMQRMQAAYTRTVTLAEPPAGAAPRPPPPVASPPAATRALVAARAASAAERRDRRDRLRHEAAMRRTAEEAARAAPTPDAAAPGATPPPVVDLARREPSEPRPERLDTDPAAPAAAASEALPQAPVQSAASAAVGPAFAWPASTRLEYRLTGWYQGEVHGSARVDWLREGERYQTHLEVFIGPSFAPLVTRRMSSEGVVTAQGLSPRRYEQETKQMLRAPRLATMRFDAEGITLASGRRVAPITDVQDTASQFIQMIFLFSTRPELREAGRAVEIGLALPNRADRWVYEVGPLGVQDTPAGAVEAFHVRPRRAAAPGDLSAEIWYAPRLSMLPVRFRIRQDADTYVDIFLEQAPKQAGP